MRLILIVVIFASLSIVSCLEEYVTVWAPSKVYDEKNYNIVFLSNDIETRTEIAFQFRKNYGTLPLVSDKMQKLRISNSHKNGAKEDFELFMTLHRNESTPTSQRQMCMTQTIQNIEVEKKHFYTFIQTDKPIYKPGDIVRFRVVVVDRDLRPYHMNKIIINVTDSLNRPIKEYDDLDEHFVGVFTGNLELSTNTSLGVWKIRVVVDLLQKLETYKEFTVQKLTPQPFAAHLTVAEKHLLPNSVLQLGFYAKNQAEDFVTGNAELTIKCLNTGQIVISQLFTNVNGIQNMKYKAQEDLKANSFGKLEYEVTLTFTDPESGIKSSKTLTFIVHLNNRAKIRASYSQKFMPGLPFHVKVFVYDWKDELITKSIEVVEIVCTIRHQNGSMQELYFIDTIKNGVTEKSFIVPIDADELTVKINYLDTVFEKMFERGAAIIGANKLAVDHTPKSPNRGDIVTVYVRSDSELDQLIAIVTTRNGKVESHQINCNYETTCKFNFTVRKGMMPEAKVVVYLIQEKANIHQGETTIMTEDLGRNWLDVDVVKTAEPGSQVEMKFTTQPDSVVYLLGYDKRLSYLFQGNEINKDDVVKELVDYDGSNKITFLHMESTNWRECTQLELRRIEKGRSQVVDHSVNEFTAYEDDEEIDYLEEELKSEQDQEETSKASVHEIREDFQGVWLFDDFEVPEGELTKTFVTPDSITSWMISSLSMNNEHGLAIGQPKELIVKN